MTHLNVLTPMPCRHLNFEARVVVNRLLANQGDEFATNYSADVTIRCIDCSESFVFLGLPGGMQPIQPTCSFDRKEARMPVAPQSEFIALTKEPGRA